MRRREVLRFGDELDTLAMAGAVTATSVRLWARSDRTGAHVVEIEPGGLRREVEIADGPSDRTGAWTVDGLAPATAYTFRIAHVDGVIGEGRFRTAAPPGDAASFTFAALSCHQPFEPDGAVADEARDMLEVARRTLVERDVAFVLATGDQIYADAPGEMSMLTADALEWSRDDARARYQQRYRQFWAMPELHALYAAAASWPMLDDHEIADDFGSVPAHATSAWDALREGALDAYHDYQASRVLDSRRACTDHGFRWGGAAVYQLDVRSERRAEADRTHVLSTAQLARFTRFLSAHADARVLVVVISVPIVFMPSWATVLAEHVAGHAADAMDRWTHARCLHDRDELLRVLCDHADAHPAQEIVLVSGDIHVGSAHAIHWPNGRVFYQLTASAITNRLGAKDRVVYETLPRLPRRVNIGDRTANVELLCAPYGGLNLGLVHVEDDGTRARVRFELVGLEGTVWKHDG